MNELDCAQCSEQAAEFTLGVLEARERAEVLAHLQRCAYCEASVAGLAATVIRLIELLPEVDPPPGFDQRVLAALIQTATTETAATEETDADGRS
jgi:anti-sigma-K factor RskA